MKKINKLAAILEKCPYILLYTHFNLPTWVLMNSRHHLTSLTTLDNVTFYGIPHPHFGDPAAGLLYFFSSVNLNMISRTLHITIKRLCEVKM